MNLSGTIGAISGLLTVTAINFALPNLPPIQIREISYDPQTHVYTLDRFVRSSVPIYSPFSIFYVDASTERVVMECKVDDYADFGKDEQERQSWPMTPILGQDCINALKAGRQYYIVSTITPLGKRPTSARSEIFTIP